jgi:hypothetical protein
MRLPPALVNLNPHTSNTVRIFAFRTQLSRVPWRMRRAVVVHAKCHIADLNRLAMLRGRVGQHHLVAPHALVKRRNPCWAMRP